MLHAASFADTETSYVFLQTLLSWTDQTSILDGGNGLLSSPNNILGNDMVSAGILLWNTVIVWVH